MGRAAGSGRVQSFMLILGRVESGWVTSVVGWVGSGRVKKIGPTSNSGSVSVDIIRLGRGWHVWALRMRKMGDIEPFVDPSPDFVQFIMPMHEAYAQTAVSRMLLSG